MSYSKDVQDAVLSICELTECVFKDWQPSPHGIAVPLVNDKNGSTRAIPLVIDWEKTRLNFEHELNGGL